MPHKMSRDEQKLAREFCNEVKLWRAGSGVTQAELARMIHQSPSWVSMMENAAVLPEYSMRHRLRLAMEEVEFRRAARRHRNSERLDEGTER